MNYNNPDSFGSPTSSQTGLSNTNHISIEQLQWLLKILSTEDRDKLGSQMKQCSSEMLLKRGLPLSAVICGSLYYARKRLPQKLQFGNKSWPVLLIAGVGSLTLTNLLTVNTCGERVKPLLMELYQKYDTKSDSNTGKTYETLRRANRLAAEQNISQYSENKKQYFEDRNDSDQFLGSESNKDFAKSKNTLANNKTSFLQHDDFPLMPGTPYGSPTINLDNEMSYSSTNDEKPKNRYGDVDFS